MARFRKKPVVVEAVPVSHILEGRMRGDYTDWLVCGTKGEVYPVKDEIFRECYEQVDL